MVIESRSRAVLLDRLTTAEEHPPPGGDDAYQALVRIGTHLQAGEVHGDDVFGLIVGHVKKLLDGDVAWLALADPAEGTVRVQVAAGALCPDFARMEVPFGAGIGGAAVDRGRPIVVRDATRYDNDLPAAVADTLRREGIQSILCAPMAMDGAVVGALYIGSREVVAFDSAASALLSSVAAQAAVTIQNARLYQTLTEQRDTLQQAFEAHRILTDASLSGAGVEKIAAELGRLMRCVLDLEVYGGIPRSLRFAADGVADLAFSDRAAQQPAKADRDEACVSVPIIAGGTELGRLRALGMEFLAPVQLRTLEHGATVIALELVKEQAVLEVEWRMQGELFEELVRTSETVPESLKARAARMGMDLDLPHRVGVLTPFDEAHDARLMEFVRRHLRSASGLVSRHEGRIVIVLADIDGQDLVTELHQRAARAQIAFSCGLSRAHTRLDIAVREANAAHGLARRSRHMLISYEQLGPLRFLLDSTETGETLGVVEEYLGPLIAHDAQRHGDLAPTLRAFLANGGHHPSTCADCHIHASTLKYRLGRIAAITGQDLNDPTTRFHYRLAFELLAFLELLGVSPFGQRS
ncbi:helix-turn-helix domain-containing protein [Amycolatopsis pigmentata]|uniref:Helix-turn-helix domain-containing protein n=1 Tax=Amycolatopsis pigmentata TaxID=450801 RepID=A0ABW5FKW9_9PSEU